jgi:hypothetical protein
VGSLVRLGPVGLTVSEVARQANAPIFGGSVFPPTGFELLVLDIGLRNASERYVALVVDGVEVAIPGRLVDPIGLFRTTAGPSRGGLAFLPGEYYALRLHYSVPVDVDTAQLRVTTRVRALPDAVFEAVGPVTVDLDARTGTPVTFRQALSAPVLSVGETADHRGLSVHVEDVREAVDLPLHDPRPGGEHVAVGLSVTNEAGAGPVLAGVGGFGGMALGDDDGGRFADRVWFGGEVAGRPNYDDASPIGPGETEAGTVVVEVPEGRAPLYLFWTPPAAHWLPDSGVATNRYVWRLR